nr:hypothetical protein CFP56_34526 [Quercus suber]
MSYIDICLPGFLSRGLIIGETRERGPCLRKANSLEPISDSSRETVFQGRVEHTLVEEPTVVAPNATMVQWCNMEIERYFSDARLVRDSLGQALLPLEDMKYWLDCKDEDIALNLKWHTIAATQMTHILKGWLYLATEKVDRERTHKQVVESTFQKKVLKLAHMEQRAIVAERA